MNKTDSTGVNEEGARRLKQCIQDIVLMSTYKSPFSISSLFLLLAAGGSLFVLRLRLRRRSLVWGFLRRKEVGEWMGWRGGLTGESFWLGEVWYGTGVAKKTKRAPNSGLGPRGVYEVHTAMSMYLLCKSGTLLLPPAAPSGTCWALLTGEVPNTCEFTQKKGMGGLLLRPPSPSPPPPSFFALLDLRASYGPGPRSINCLGRSPARKGRYGSYVQVRVQVHRASTS